METVSPDTDTGSKRLMQPCSGLTQHLGPTVARMALGRAGPHAVAFVEHLGVAREHDLDDVARTGALDGIDAGVVELWVEQAVQHDGDPCLQQSLNLAEHHLDGRVAKALGPLAVLHPQGVEQTFLDRVFCDDRNGEFMP